MYNNELIINEYKDLYPDFLNTYDDKSNVSKHISILSELVKTSRTDKRLLEHQKRLHKPLTIQKEYVKNYIKTERLVNLLFYRINYNFKVQIQDIKQVEIYRFNTKLTTKKEFKEYVNKVEHKITPVNSVTFNEKGHHEYHYTEQIDIYSLDVDRNYYYLRVLCYDGAELIKGYPENEPNNNDYSDEIFSHDRTLDNYGALLNIARHNYIIKKEYLNDKGELEATEEELSKFLPSHFVKYDRILDETGKVINWKLLTEYTEDDYYYQQRILKYLSLLYSEKAGKNNINTLPVINLWKEYNIQPPLQNQDRKLCKQRTKQNTGEKDEYCMGGSKCYQTTYKKIVDNKIIPTSYNPETFDLTINLKDIPFNLKFKQETFEENVIEYLPVTKRVDLILSKLITFSKNLTLKGNLKLITDYEQDIIDYNNLIYFAGKINIDDDYNLIIEDGGIKKYILTLTQNGQIKGKPTNNGQHGTLTVNDDLDLIIEGEKNAK